MTSDDVAVVVLMVVIIVLLVWPDNKPPNNERSFLDHGDEWYNFYGPGGPGRMTGA